MDIKVTQSNISIAYLIRFLVLTKTITSPYTIDEIDDKIDWLHQTNNGSMTIHL